MKQAINIFSWLATTIQSGCKHMPFQTKKNYTVAVKLSSTVNLDNLNC